MAKEKISFICQQCGYESPKFLGKCVNCGEWNSLVETLVSTKNQSASWRAKIKDQKEKGTLVKLSAIKAEKIERIKTGISELDQVLGGGLVPGQVVLLAGEPGVGKSTLLLQLAAKYSNSTVFYISGEESVEQIGLRAKRLGIDGKNDITLFSETNVESIILEIEKPALPSGRLRNKEIKGKNRNYSITQLLNCLIIVDSIQTMWTEELTGTPGSVGQVRESARKLAECAKAKRVPLIIIGHVTKEGAIAGPKVLEHLVDAVLYLEGERFEKIRLLRVSKNRFGPIDEVGVFKMEESGFVEVFNPSEMFYEKRGKNLPGSAVVVIMEGTRPLLVEIQALVSYSELKSPRRIGNGVSFNRLIMICAILAKHLRLPLEKFDVYVNVSGGLRIEEPAADLAVASAIYSSFKNLSLPKNSCFLGELSLLGEVRAVSSLEKRIKEAKKLGFSKIFEKRQYQNLKEVIGGIVKGE